MNKRKLLTLLAAFGPLMLWAGAAFAANSGTVNLVRTNRG